MCTFALVMNNTRFATAIHILTLLAKNPNEFLNSEWIAGSINVNPVMVRKEIGALKKVGLVQSKNGKDGGCRLTKNETDIKLSEIYEAVTTTEILGRKNKNPNPHCPVGKKINSNLTQLESETAEQIIQFLGNKNLSDFARQFS